MNSAQQERLHRLENILGDNALRYCLYCPPTRGLSDVLQTQVRALHTRNLVGLIFDFGVGLALRDTLVASGRIDYGIWFTRIDSRPTRLVELHDWAFRSASPLTWFLLEHFGSDGFGRDRRNVIDKERTDPRVRGVVTGDDRTIRELIGELQEAGEDREAPELITVLPRHTITIAVTVGRDLSPDVARVQLA